MKTVGKTNKVQLYIFIIIAFIILSVGYAIITVKSIEKKRVSSITYNKEQTSNTYEEENSKSIIYNNNSKKSHFNQDLINREDINFDVLFLKDNTSPRIISGI